MSEWKHTIDLGAVASLFGVLMGALPGIAALLTVIWMVLRIHNEAAEALDRYRRQHRAAPVRVEVEAPEHAEAHEG